MMDPYDQDRPPAFIGCGWLMFFVVLVVGAVVGTIVLGLSR